MDCRTILEGKKSPVSQEEFVYIFYIFISGARETCGNISSINVQGTRSIGRVNCTNTIIKLGFTGQKNTKNDQTSILV